MSKSKWGEFLFRLNEFIRNPVQIDNLKITMIDVVSASHNQGWVSSNHHHPWFEFTYVSEGCFFTTLENTEFITNQGNSLLIPPDLYHSHRNSSMSNNDGFCILFQLEYTDSSDQTATDTWLTENLIETMSTAQPYSFNDSLINKFIINVSSDKGPPIPIAFCNFIFDLYRLLQEKKIIAQGNPPLKNAIVSQACLYMSEYYANEIHVMELANLVNVSYRSLARSFKQATGMTIIKKLNDIRIHEAQKLLRNTEKPIRQIAVEVGFENEYYFSRIFSHRTCITPSEFRKKFKS